MRHREHEVKAGYDPQDGICLNASVWVDGEQILERGRSVHPELAEFARALGKQ